MKEVVKKEVIKLLDAGIIYPISDSPWEKATFTCLYGIFAYRRMPFGLCNTLATLQRCVMAIFHELIEDNIEDAKFDFSIDCVEVFETLKKELTKAPMMVKADWSLPFELMCDASNYAVDVVLGQRSGKYFQLIYYASKTMTDAQENYTTTKKELLAVVFAFDKFRQYLVLSKTIVYTDHFAL
ncbi:reverse transcriptase domain-containing protein [Tanacetum coccineum]